MPADAAWSPAGIEGLRGLCVPKAVAEDTAPLLMRSSLPKPWQYPVMDIAFPFGTSLVTMFYGPGIMYKIKVGAQAASCICSVGINDSMGRSCSS